MKLFKKLLIRSQALYLGGLTTLMTSPAFAALPTPVAPSTAPASGDYIGLWKGYAKDVGIVLGLVISVSGFLWIAYGGFAKFNEVRNGKAEWGELGLYGLGGAGCLIFATYLLGQAAGII